MFWEQYGEFCKSEFTNIHFNKQAVYKFTIYKKNYTEQPIPCLCGKDPAILKFLNDELIGIKGAELRLNLINIDNQFPASLFYCESDDEFKIDFWVEYSIPDPDNPFAEITTTRAIFSGYLLQDQIKEILTDIGHEIEITFTDNLGILKDISFGDAAKLSPSSAANIREVSAYITATAFPTELKSKIKVTTPVPNQGNPQVGDYMYITQSPVGNFSFMIIGVTAVGPDLEIEVDERIPVSFLNYPTTIYYLTGLNLTDFYSIGNITKQNKIRLDEVIRICLHATGLSLGVRYLSGLEVVAGLVSPKNIFQNVYISLDTLRSGDEFISCYQVLENICKRFRFTLYQSNLEPSVSLGKPDWFFVRYYEYKYPYPIDLQGFSYDQYMTYNSTPIFSYKMNYDIGRIEFGSEETITRPTRSILDKFDFEYSDELLYNSKLSNTGKFIGSQYVTQILYNGFNSLIYKAEGFFGTPFNPTTQYEATIQILYDDLYVSEKERWLVVKPLGTALQNPTDFAAVLGVQLEVNINDWIEYSFDYRCFPISDNNNLPVLIQFTDLAGTKYYLNEDGNWDTSTSNLIYIEEATVPEWKSSPNWKSKPFPGDGHLLVTFGQYSVFGFGGSNTYYRNIDLKYYAGSGSGVNIVGQEHTGYIFSQLKNSKDDEINYDCTNKNQVLGTLFLQPIDNIYAIDPKANTWSDGQTAVNYRLGEIVSRQEMNLYYTKRLFLECKLLGLFNPIYKFNNLFGWAFLTPTALIQSNVNPNKKFAIGRLEYNFREDFAECDLYEIFDVSEAGGDSRSNELVQYGFKYKYK